MPAAIPLAMVAGSAIAGAIASHSANKAADAQSKSNSDALSFEKQKDAQDRAQAEAVQRANYNQYLDKYNAGRALGAEYGLQLPEARPYVPVTQAGQPGQPGQPAQGGKPGAEDFIRQYQKNNPQVSLPGILSALQQNGYDAKPFMYGNTPSGNEIALNGQKYKVIAGENGANPSWYAAGTNDGGGLPTGRMGYASPITGYLARTVQPPQAQPFRLRSINALM